MLSIKNVAPLLALSLFAVVALVSVPAQAQWPPVDQVVSHFDQRCYTFPAQHAVGVPLTLSHLNPVLVQLGAKDHDVTLEDPQELCVPVQKDDEKPPTGVHKVVQWLDWECFGIKGDPLNITLDLDHLNPVIKAKIGLRDRVIVREPQQLCVPVAKDGKIPPDDVIRLIQNIDVECYRVEAREFVGGESIKLTHLNPLLEGLPSEEAIIRPRHATQLCVPVAKNKVFPPHDVYLYAAFTDSLCYEIDAPPLDRTIKLDQLNPQLIDRIGTHEVGPLRSHKLCVPVAKNGNFPPQ
jgi:hypothetical protein